MSDIASGIKPYYEERGIKIYHGDCREILPELGRFDLLLTDPPYGIGIAANPVRQAHAVSDWDNSVVSEELLNDSIGLCAEQVIWGGNYFKLPPSQGFLVWDKMQPQELTLSMCEMAWISRQQPAKMFRRSVTSYLKEHPTEKPLDLFKWCLSLFPTAKTVLDPFLGSGTTLVAAKAMGLAAVGVEREEKYCEIAANRLRQEVLDFEALETRRTP